MILDYQEFLNENASLSPSLTLPQIKKLIEKPSRNSKDMIDDFLGKYDLYDVETGKLNYASCFATLVLENSTIFPTKVNFSKIVDTRRKGKEYSKGLELLRIIDEEFEDPEYMESATKDTFYWEKPTSLSIKHANDWGFNLFILSQVPPDKKWTNYFFMFVEDEALTQKRKGFLTGKRFGL